MQAPPAAQAERAPGGSPGPEPVQPVRVGWDRIDAALLACAAVGTVLVHPVHAILTHPYWLDEAWVAILTRVPLDRLARLTSSTPLGFSFLLRLVPGTGQQRARLVVLAFSALATTAAYALGRSLPWRSRVRSRFAGAFVAGAVMLSPFLLVRNDLKQYSCDAFAALAILTVATWVERSADGARPWWSTVVALVLLPFSTASAFVTVAAFTGLLVVSLRRAHAGPRTRDVLVAGGVTAAGFAAWFAAVVLPNTNAGLRAYWLPYYLRNHAPGALLRSVWQRFDALHQWFGMPTLVAVVLLVLGLVVLARIGAPALTVAIPVLAVEMVVAGIARRYPFLDLRTSTFFLATIVAVVAVGSFGVIQWIFTRQRVVGALLGAGVVALFTVSVASYVREPHFLGEDTRTVTEYVAAHRRPGDVVVVSRLGQYGFTYYWPRGRVLTPPNDSAAGFGAQVQGLDAIYAPGRTGPAVLSTMREAVARWHDAGRGSRIFVVRSHVTPSEAAAWNGAFRALGLSPRVVDTGPDRLLVVGPA